MWRKFFTKTLFHFYDLRYRGAISSIYDDVRKRNSNKGDFSLDEIKKYLINWKIGEDISDLSLMNKTDVVNYTSNVNPEEVHSWAYTGGSFGEPLRVPYSLQRNFIRTATFKYFNELGGYSLGDSFALIRAKEKSTFIKFLRNEYIIIPHNVSQSSLEYIINNLIKKKVLVLMGYPTVMFDMAELLSRKADLKSKLKVKYLISASEMLDDHKRQFIYDVFGCSFIDRYSNEEVGLIAQQSKFGGEYIVNRFGVFVEILSQETLQPVKTGELGKVVVTDIYNDLVPIIRYDTGDLAIAGTYKNGQLTTIRRVVGRVAEKLNDTEGKPISSLSIGPGIYKPLSNKGYTFQFQLAQISQIKYEFRVKAGEKDLDKETLSQIMDNLKSSLGREAEIIVAYVSDIPPQPSGKRPVYKNEMN